MIRLLEPESNQRGDLFVRLMGDLFIALGYERPRQNVHKSGREIDLEAVHRIEQRRVIGECKATLAPVGGSDINKFIGVLDAERRTRRKLPTTGYYVSLSGFTATALQQEADFTSQRLVLLNGGQVIHELVQGRIVVPLAEAVERAGRCAAANPELALSMDRCELLGHKLGWIWLVPFETGKRFTHYALIHADGEPLAPELAAQVAAADGQLDGVLRGASYLAPSESARPRQDRLEMALRSYTQYLLNECGDIQLEGLPADQDTGSRRFNLESLFVPLHLTPIVDSSVGRSLAPGLDLSFQGDGEWRIPVGKVLSEQPRIAVLAPPGGGKTTLIRRLAVAYAFPERRAQGGDDLPEKAWLPLLIRCRQLANRARSPIGEVVENIPSWAEMTPLAAEFKILVEEALRSGDALMLVDGLDEISNEGDRVQFVQQLRTFLSIYPEVPVVVTSREAGFRVVGGVLNSVCTHYTLSKFDRSDVNDLVVRWHREVIGARTDVHLEAVELADAIWESSRVRALAVNPLLLTTLLLVKRWAGRLPNRRSVLYGKAIEVLLMTWNVAGHSPIDLDEAVPQLAYVAFSMMREGVQRITLKRLRELLFEARAEMPELLSFARLGVSEFVERVELRSSLLTLSGHTIEHGTLLPVYEFQHLTFQEYLAARAIVEGFYPDRTDHDTELGLLARYLHDPRWREVVALTAVLAGREAQPLVQRLEALCREGVPGMLNILIQCIGDECKLAPNVLATALDCIARRADEQSELQEVYTSRYSDAFYTAMHDAYFSGASNLVFLGSMLSYQEELHRALAACETSGAAAELLKNRLTQADGHAAAIGALVVMDIACDYHTDRDQLTELKVDDTVLREMVPAVLDLLATSDRSVYFSACWALVWLGNARLVPAGDARRVLPRLFEIWRTADCDDIRFVSSWAIGNMPLLQRTPLGLAATATEISQFLSDRFSLEDHWLSLKEALAALMIAYYQRVVWSEQQMVEHLSRLYTRVSGNGRAVILAMLGTLGKQGEAARQVLTSKFPAIEDVALGADGVPRGFRQHVQSSVRKLEDIGLARWDRHAHLVGPSSPSPPEPVPPIPYRDIEYDDLGT